MSSIIFVWCFDTKCTWLLNPLPVVIPIVRFADIISMMADFIQFFSIIRLFVDLSSSLERIYHVAGLTIPRYWETIGHLVETDAFGKTQFLVMWFSLKLKHVKIRLKHVGSAYADRSQWGNSIQSWYTIFLIRCMIVEVGINETLVDMFSIIWDAFTKRSFLFASILTLFTILQFLLKQCFRKRINQISHLQVERKTQFTKINI